MDVQRKSEGLRAFAQSLSTDGLDEAATRRSRLAEPHDIFCTFISSPLREVILQYFVRINQHDERFGR
ncbi:MAG: hypothetical protein Q8N46_11060, partial [Anaerolineales bacterium]|nr:hypothetical protein [Anaerolineales bacterium]